MESWTLSKQIVINKGFPLLSKVNSIINSKLPMAAPPIGTYIFIQYAIKQHHEHAWSAQINVRHVF